MKKAISIILFGLPPVLYIIFFQMLYPPKQNLYNEFYEAERIEIIMEEDATLTIYPSEEENIKEIVKAKNVYIKLLGNVKVNNKKVHSNDFINIDVSGKSIHLESTTEIIIYGEYETLKINEDNTTRNVAISVGTILGVLTSFFIVKSSFPKKLKITVTFTLVTLVLFFLRGIINDMFWVLLSIDAGWLLFITTDSIGNKGEEVNN